MHLIEKAGWAAPSCPSQQRPSCSAFQALDSAPLQTQLRLMYAVPGRRDQAAGLRRKSTLGGLQALRAHRRRPHRRPVRPAPVKPATRRPSREIRETERRERERERPGRARSFFFWRFHRPPKRRVLFSGFHMQYCVEYGKVNWSQIKASWQYVEKRDQATSFRIRGRDERDRVGDQ